MADGSATGFLDPRNFPSGLCRHCKQPRTAEGHDPCIANTPGVKFACCGHGYWQNSYYVFTNLSTLYGSPAFFWKYYSQSFYDPQIIVECPLFWKSRD